MTPSRLAAIVPSIALACAALLLSSASAFAAGGTAMIKHDGGGSDGWCTLFANGQDGNRWAIRYGAHEFDPTAVICQGQAYIFSFQTRTDVNSANYDPRTLYTTLELRSEDPGNPGFPDVTANGLLATGSPVIVAPGAYTLATANFNYPADSTQTVFLTWTEALTTAPSGGVVCQMIDTNNPRGASNDSRTVSAIGVSAIEQTWDFIGSLSVFHTREVNLRFLARGSQRFPGDRGIPLVFTRRLNPGNVAETDDFVSFDAVIDNNSGSPVSGDFVVQVDRNVFTGGPPSWVDITRFFAPRIENPLTLVPGRTILTASIPRPIKERFIANFPVNIPARALLSIPEGGALIDGEPSTWGLRASAGEMDLGTDDIGFIVRSPAFTNDSLAVRFLAQDMPKAGYVVTGLGVAGVEVGGTPLPGYDALEFRLEDPVTSLPDYSPVGLLRSIGNRDGIGEVTLGGTSGTIVDAVYDLLDVFMDPLASESTNLWVDVSYRPGDGVATGATLIMADNRAATRLPNTYFSEGGNPPVRVRDFMTQHWMAEVRLLIQNRFNTLEPGSQSREAGRKPGLVTDVLGAVPRTVRVGEGRLPD